MNPLTTSATALARALREGRLRSVDLIEAHIERIERVNPKLNAVVATRFDQARAEAQAADSALAQGEPGALLGVPITVKEFIAVQGMPHSAGLQSRHAIRAERDAPAVARLRGAGAIVLGVTNGPEGGLWSETTNPVYGRTNNPWDLSRTPGGSSGGEAAIIAAGGSPLGLGSDIGGSVRIPAAFCGIPAHKPTGGILSTQGHHPPHPSSYLCIGPMARRVEDLITAMHLLLPDDGLADPYLLPPESLTVLLPDQALRRPSGAVTRAVERAASTLRNLGAEVRACSMPDLDRAFWIWAAALTESDGPSYADVLFDGQARSIWPELARAVVGASDHSAPPLLVAATETLTGALRIMDRQRLLKRQLELRAELAERLDSTTVLLLPTMPRPAPRHGGMFLNFADSGWCGLFNVLDLPATTVPFGRAGRLPIGIQLVAASELDHVTLAAAYALEQAAGGWEQAEP